MRFKSAFAMMTLGVLSSTAAFAATVTGSKDGTSITLKTDGSESFAGHTPVKGTYTIKTSDNNQYDVSNAYGKLYTYNDSSNFYGSTFDQLANAKGAQTHSLADLHQARIK